MNTFLGHKTLAERLTVVVLLAKHTSLKKKIKKIKKKTEAKILILSQILQVQEVLTSI